MMEFMEGGPFLTLKRNKMTVSQTLGLESQNKTTLFPPPFKNKTASFS